MAQIKSTFIKIRYIMSSKASPVFAVYNARHYLRPKNDRLYILYVMAHGSF